MTQKPPSHHVNRSRLRAFVATNCISSTLLGGLIGLVLVTMCDNVSIGDIAVTVKHLAT